MTSTEPLSISSKVQILPKFVTHTCLVMIPKRDHPQKFTDLRPINLCNVSSTFICEILYNRTSSLLLESPRTNLVLSEGRGISENILLAQKIINDIKKPARGGNVVLKLDMAKAYDRVSMEFLC